MKTKKIGFIILIDFISYLFEFVQIERKFNRLKSHKFLMLAQLFSVTSHKIMTPFLIL